MKTLQLILTLFHSFMSWFEHLNEKKKPKSAKRYTWRPDLPDHRDLMLSIPTGTVLPAAVDLRSQMSPIEDQGQLGSCTCNAIAGALEFLENKTLPKGSFVDISRLFIYYNERKIEGTINQDSGAQIRDGVKACANVGACNELLWPYIISKFARKPTPAAFIDAGKRKITQYLRITNLDGIKHSLAQGYPVVFGFTVYDAFESQDVATSGVLNMPQASEKQVGGHAVLCVGYDDTTQRVTVRNSWGPDWGQKGYFTMPYAYISNANLASDFWSIQK